MLPTESFFFDISFRRLEGVARACARTSAGTCPGTCPGACAGASPGACAGACAGVAAVPAIVFGDDPAANTELAVADVDVAMKLSIFSIDIVADIGFPAGITVSVGISDGVVALADTGVAEAVGDVVDAVVEDAGAVVSVEAFDKDAFPLSRFFTASTFSTFVFLSSPTFASPTLASFSSRSVALTDPSLFA